MASSSASRAKQKAAEARAAAEASEKRRRRLINFAIVGVVVVAVVAIIGFAFLAKNKDVQQVQANSGAQAPDGTYPADTQYQYGWPLGKAAADKPTLAIWEDFQCPACDQFEKAFGPTIEKMANAGEATVIWRSTSFLDQRFPGQSSQRSAAAWGCAINAGKGKEYHDLVFANQPATEGQGYTDEQLLAFGEQAGITGQAKTTFDDCVKAKTFMSWAANGTATMASDGVQATPGIYLNGKHIDTSDPALKSPEAFQAAVLAAGAAASASPSAS